MRLMNNLKKAAIAAIMFAALNAAPSAAFSVLPMKIELNAAPGASYTTSIVIDNSGAGELQMGRVYIQDWDKQPSGKDVYHESGEVDRSCGGWITLSQSQFNVPAGEKAEARFSFSVPQDASGLYWTFIMVEGMPTPQKPSSEDGRFKTAITTNMRYGVRVFINVKSGIAARGELSSLTVSRPDAQSEFKDFPLVANIGFFNTGNTLLTPHGVLEVRTLAGKTIHTAAVSYEKKYVIPGRERIVTVPIEARLAPNEYVALVIMDYGGEKLVAGQTSFASKNISTTAPTGYEIDRK